MKDTRNLLEIKLDALLRLSMWYGLKTPLKQVLVSEFPKSGGSWFCQMLAESLELPFPRNQMPLFESCILHGHHLYHPRFDKMIGVVRDGRDVMVSAYFYFLFENDRNPTHLIKHFRKALPFENYEDVKENMPKFIQYMFEEYPKRRFHFSWSESVRSFCNNKNVKLVKYEDLLLKPIHELKAAINFLEKPVPSQGELKRIVNRYSFSNLAQRKPGEENRNSFLRKGIAGDWKNYFGEKASCVFKKYGGDELVALGYD